MPSSRATFSRSRPWLAALLLPLLLTACGNGGDARGPNASPTPTPTAETVLKRAGDRLAATQTVGFMLEVEGDTYVDEGKTIRLLEAEGELARPDRVRTTFKAKVLAPTVTIQLITVGDRSWTTNLITGDWEPAPPEFSYSPVVLFDNQNGIGPVMGRVDAPKLLADEEIDGRPAYHVAATVAEAVIGPLTGNTMSGTPVAVDLWVAKETGDLLRARLAEPPSAEKDDPATWVLDLREHGAKVEIEPPI